MTKQITLHKINITLYSYHAQYSTLIFTSLISFKPNSSITLLKRAGYWMVT